MISDEKNNGTSGTADLWRAAQISRSFHLVFWLRSLFRKQLPHRSKAQQHLQLHHLFG